MMVTLEARAPCPVDGYLVSWFTFPSVRVNKRSLRDLGGVSLSWREGCTECGMWPVWDRPAGPWRLTADSQREVDEYRAKKWPELVAA
jgi:hypothetical protein